MKYLQRFLKDRRAVSPVIGVILMVAITVVMAAVVGGWVYSHGMPKTVPTMAATLQDDPRVTLTKLVTPDGRVAMLTILGGPNIAKSELQCVATYRDNDGVTEYTKTLDGGLWGDGTATQAAVPMGNSGTAINLKWVDSDASGEISAGDRLDFTETGAAAGQQVCPNTDFTVKVIHKGSEAVLVDQTIKVY